VVGNDDDSGDDDGDDSDDDDDDYNDYHVEGMRQRNGLVFKQA